MNEIRTNTFKLQGFRENQKQSINAVMSGRDCITLMPTGSGKSLIFQLMAYHS
jgi:ATP-dependent DNA helicase RecQ